MRFVLCAFICSLVAAASPLQANTADCSAPELISFQNDAGPCREGSRISNGSACTATCAPDFVPSIPQLTCSGGVLTPERFACLSPCQAPSVAWIEGAEPAGTCAEGERIIHGAGCTAQCQGIWSPSPTRLECHAGSLAPPLFTCLPRCAAPRDVASAAAAGACLEGLEIVHEGACTAACASGHTPSVSSLDCMAGTLAPGTFRCEPDCPAPRDVAFSSLAGACREGELIPFGTSCTGACEEGFAPDPVSISCEGSGLFSPAKFACRASCSAPQGIEHASQSGVCQEGIRVVTGAACTVTCEEGFMPLVSSLTCTDGVLSPKSTQCVEKCAPPLGIAHTPPAGACAGAPGSIASGDSCRGICNEGFLPDVPELACMDGLLIPSHFICVADCDAPTGIPNASLHGACIEGDTLPHHQTCTTSCAPGFIPSTSTLTCDYGLFAPETFSCERGCFAADVENLDPMSTCAEIRAGETCTAQCLPGFQPSSEVLNCSEGLWYPPTFRCTPYSCQVPNIIGAAETGVCAEGASVVHHGAACRLQCSLGYESRQPGAFLCNNGTFLPPLECVLVEPRVVLYGPGSIVACTTIVVSAEATLGLFGHPPLAASWSCNSPQPLCRELQPLLTAAANSMVLVFNISAASFISLPAGSSLSLMFNLTNFQGSSGYASLTVPLIEVATSVPAVHALGPANSTWAMGAPVTFQVVQRHWSDSEDLSSYYDAGIRCPSVFPMFDVEWKRRPLSDPDAVEELILPSADHAPSASVLRLTPEDPVLRHPGDWVLMADVFYNASRALDSRLYSRLVYILHVRAFPPKAALTVPAEVSGCGFVADATDSKLSEGSSGPLLFRWSCDSGSLDTGDTACTKAVQQWSGPIEVMPPGLPLGSYHLSVEVIDAYTGLRSHVGTGFRVALSFNPLNQTAMLLGPPQVAFDTLPASVSSRIALKVKAIAPAHCILSASALNWSLEATSMGFNETIPLGRLHHEAESLAVITHYARTNVPAASLGAGRRYRLRLRDSSHTMLALSQELLVLPTLQGGRVVVVPPSGSAATTLFCAEQSQWNDGGDLPIQFAFAMYLEEGHERPLQSWGESSSVCPFLVPRAGHWNIIARARNIVGDTTITTASLPVHERPADVPLSRVIAVVPSALSGYKLAHAVQALAGSWLSSATLQLWDEGDQMDMNLLESLQVAVLTADGSTSSVQQCVDALHAVVLPGGRPHRPMIAHAMNFSRNIVRITQTLIELISSSGDAFQLSTLQQLLEALSVATEVATNRSPQENVPQLQQADLGQSAVMATRSLGSALARSVAAVWRLSLAAGEVELEVSRMTIAATVYDVEVGGFRMSGTVVQAFAGRRLSACGEEAALTFLRIGWGMDLFALGTRAAAEPPASQRSVQLLEVFDACGNILQTGRLSEPVSIWLPLDEPLELVADEQMLMRVCVAWNESQGAWSSAGCREEASLTNFSHVRCLCDYLAPVALVLRPEACDYCKNDYPSYDVFSLHSLQGNIFQLAVCAASLAFLAIPCAVFAWWDRKSRLLHDSSFYFRDMLPALGNNQLVCCPPFNFGCLTSPAVLVDMRHCHVEVGFTAHGAVRHHYRRQRCSLTAALSALRIVQNKKAQEGAAALGGYRANGALGEDATNSQGRRYMKSFISSVQRRWHLRPSGKMSIRSDVMPCTALAMRTVHSLLSIQKTSRRQQAETAGEMAVLRSLVEDQLRWSSFRDAQRLLSTNSKVKKLRFKLPPREGECSTDYGLSPMQMYAFEKHVVARMQASLRKLQALRRLLLRREMARGDVIGLVCHLQDEAVEKADEALDEGCKWVDHCSAEVTLPVESATKGDVEIRLDTWLISVSWRYVAETCNNLEDVTFGRLWVKPTHAKQVPGHSQPPRLQRVCFRSVMAPGVLPVELPLPAQPNGGRGWHCFPLHSFVKTPVCRLELRTSTADLAVSETATLVLPTPTDSESWQEVEVPLVQESSLQPKPGSAEAACATVGTLGLKYRWTRTGGAQEGERKGPDACVGTFLLKSVRSEGVSLHNPTLRVAVSRGPARPFKGFDYVERRIGLGKRGDNAGAWRWDISEKAGFFSVDWRKPKVTMDQCLPLRQYFAMASVLAPDDVVEIVATRLQYFYWSKVHLFCVIAQRENLWRRLTCFHLVVVRTERYAIVASGVAVAALFASIFFREECAYVPPPAACTGSPRFWEALIASIWGTLLAAPLKWLIHYCFHRRIYLSTLTAGQKQALMCKRTLFCGLGWLLAITIYALSILLALTYIAHYSWQMVQSWTIALGFCILHPILLLPGVRTTFAFSVLMASRSFPACDALLIAAPWLTKFDQRIPASMPQLGDNWRRLRAKKRWDRVRCLVLSGLLRLMVFNGMRKNSMRSSSSELSFADSPTGSPEPSPR